MGTPNVDRAQLSAGLADILGEVQYKSMLDRETLDLEMRHGKIERRKALKQPGYKAQPFKAMTVKQFADAAVQAALGDVNQPNLTDPVYVVELKATQANIFFYRVYDGISQKTALTLGRWWCNRRLLRQVVYATSDLTGKARQNKVLEYLLSAMFVHPSWNFGTKIAQLTLSPGDSIPAIIGRGSWHAMKSAREEPKIDTEDDVIDKLGMMPIPGPKQVFLPLYNDMWVRGVPELSPEWPFN